MGVENEWTLEWGQHSRQGKWAAAGGPQLGEQSEREAGEVGPI